MRGNSERQLADPWRQRNAENLNPSIPHMPSVTLMCSWSLSSGNPLALLWVRSSQAQGTVQGTAQLTVVCSSEGHC